MWYGGTLTSAASSSSALAKSSVENTYDVTWRWRSSAALGSPVVPEVNSITSTSSVSGMVSTVGAPGTPASSSLRGDDLEPVDAVEAADHVVVDDGDRRRRPLGDAPQVGVGEAVVQRA